MSLEYFKCDSCGKTTQSEENKFGVKIANCYLTPNCKGKLRKFVPNSNVTRPEYFEIGTSQTIPADSEELLLALNNSYDGDIVLAVKNHPGITDESELTIVLEELSSQNQEFKEFVYNLSLPVISISGKDASVEQKTLKFNQTDEIRVYINGELVPSSKYSTSIPNVIKFNSSITFSDYNSNSLLAKIIVFKTVEKTQITVKFKRNVFGLSKGAWSKVSTVTFKNDTFDLFTCVDILQFSPNQRYRIVSFNIDLVDHDDMNDAIFLLSMSPFTEVDANFTTVVPINKITESFPLRMIRKDKIYQLTVNSDVVKPLSGILLVSNTFVGTIENTQQISDEAPKINHSLTTHDFINGYL